MPTLFSDRIEQRNRTPSSAGFFVVLEGADVSFRVTDQQVNDSLDPGASPSDGDKYWITVSGSLHSNFGSISGIGDNDIVRYDIVAGEFVVYIDVSEKANFDGTIMYLEDTDVPYILKDGAWTQLASTADIETYTGTTDVITVVTNVIDIADGGVSLAHMANLAANTTIVNATAGAATPAALSLGEQKVLGRLTGGNISAVSLGIADNNVVQIDDSDAATEQYARFTTTGIEGRLVADVLSDIGAAASDHNHTGVYAASDHNHDLVYAPLAHAHTGYVADTGDTMTGKLEIDVTNAAGAVVATPHIFHTDSFTYEDTATANAGTNSTELKHTVFSSPTAATDKAGIIVTTASTVKIDGPVGTDGQVAFTNNYALWVDDGLTKLDGGVESSVLTAIGSSNLQLVTDADVLVKLDHDNSGTDAVFAVRANSSSTNVFTVGETGAITGSALDIKSDPIGTITNSDTDGFIKIESSDKAGVSFATAINLGYTSGDNHAWVMSATTNNAVSHRPLRLLSRVAVDDGVNVAGYADTQVWARRIKASASDDAWEGQVAPASILIVNSETGPRGVRLTVPESGTDPGELENTWTMTLPPDNGDSGEFLTTDGSGVTSWSGLGDAHHDQYLRHDTWVQKPTQAAGSCKMCSTVNIVGTYDFATGKITAVADGPMANIDGRTSSTTNRVLLVGQTNSEENGVYTISDNGSESAPFVLTRIGVKDEPQNFENSFVVVKRGDSNSGVWACTNEGDVDIGQASPGGAVGPVYKKAYSSTHLANYVSGNGRLLGIPTATEDPTGTTNTYGGVVQEITYATLKTDLGVTDTKIGQWDAAYGWGDHGDEGYVTTALANADTLSSGRYDD